MSIELDLSGLFDLFKLSLPQKKKRVSSTDPHSRKTRWEQMVSNLSGMELWLPDWENLFELFGTNWSFNFTFNFLLDMLLSLDFHLEFEFSLDFLNEFDEFIFDEFDFHIDFLKKAYYDETEYEHSYFDPENITGNDLRKFTWWLRYKTTDKRKYCYKYTDVSAKKITETNKTLVYKQMVREWLLDGFESVISIVEGKVINSFYVGFGIVNISRVSATNQDENSYAYGKIVVRDPSDWKTPVELESNGIYDCNVGFMRVNYSRVAFSKRRYAKISGELNKRMFSKKTADRLKENVDRGREELGISFIETEYGKIQYMPARLNAYVSAEKKKWRGGRHQALMHHNAQVVKQILDEYGVAGMFRKAYQDFAMEIAYREYNPKNRVKVWKRIFSGDDEIIEKYKSYGCNIDVLREIARKVWRLRS